MGNCCCASTSNRQSSSGGGSKSFQGQGHRLGSAAETSAVYAAPSSQRIEEKDTLPEPLVDPKLDPEIRRLRRTEAARAAEERANKNGGGKPVKKKTNQEPLRGPNSEPLMRWNV